VFRIAAGFLAEAVAAAAAAQAATAQVQAVQAVILSTMAQQQQQPQRHQVVVTSQPVVAELEALQMQVVVLQTHVNSQDVAMPLAEMQLADLAVHKLVLLMAEL
jgi:hypothetical protein